MNLENGARVMYSQRPQHTDPAHWDTPWEDVPLRWRNRQKEVVAAIVDAAVGDTLAELNTLHRPVVVVREDMPVCNECKRLYPCASKRLLDRLEP